MLLVLRRLQPVLILFTLCAMSFSVALAQVPGNTGDQGDTVTGNTGDQGDSVSGNCSGEALCNPLGGIGSVNELLVAILNVLIVLATPIIVIFIILAGFKYVTARGNAQQIEEAHRALTYAVIGGVLIIGALALAEIIKNLVVAFE